MTIANLLDRVPWAEMGWRRSEALRQGLLRHQRTGLCPVAAVLGGRNGSAVEEAVAAGLSPADAIAVVFAADGRQLHQPQVGQLREEMHARWQTATMQRAVDDVHAALRAHQEVML